MGGEFVQHYAERIDVAAVVDALGIAGLLGAHVIERADDLPGTGEPLAGIELLGDTEIGQVRMVDRAEDVLGLEIAMDDSVAVRVVERGGDAAGDVHRFADRQPVAVEGAALQIHHHEGEIAVLALVERQLLHHAIGTIVAVDPMHGDDVGMVAQAVRELGLLQEAAVAGGVRTGVADLDGEPLIGRQLQTEDATCQTRLFGPRQTGDLAFDSIAAIGEMDREEVLEIVLGSIDLAHPATPDAFGQAPHADGVGNQGITLISITADGGWRDVGHWDADYGGRRGGSRGCWA